MFFFQFTLCYLKNSNSSHREWSFKKCGFYSAGIELVHIIQESKINIHIGMNHVPKSS